MIISASFRILTKSRYINDLDEKGILLSHDMVTLETDVICAVGLGGGISLIHNCLKNKPRNSFIAIEASRNQINKALANIELNKIDNDKFSIIEGYAGSQNSGIYGNSDQFISKIINVNDINFDVLELDCEGAELTILKDITVKPKHIIVEMHPNLVDIDIGELSGIMLEKGYFLAFAFTVYGLSVPTDKIPNYFSKNHLEKIKNGESWGENLLVVTFSLK